MKPIHRRVACRLSLLLLLLLVAGCQSCVPGTVRNLEIRALGDVEVLAISEESAEILISAELFNPLGDAVRVRDLEYEMALAGAFLARGRLTSELSLPAREVVMTKLPLTVRLDRVSAADFASFFEAQIPYRLRGTFTALEPIARTGLKLDIRGSASAPERLEIRLPESAARSWYAWTGVSTDLPSILRGRGTLEAVLRNPFPFALQVDRLQYEILLDGRVIGDGQIRTQTLSPGFTRIDLPVEIRPLELTESLLSTLLEARLSQPEVRGRLTLQGQARQIVVLLQ